MHFSVQGFFVRSLFCAVTLLGNRRSSSSASASVLLLSTGAAIADAVVLSLLRVPRPKMLLCVVLDDRHHPANDERK